MCYLLNYSVNIKLNLLIVLKTFDQFKPTYVTLIAEGSAIFWEKERKIGIQSTISARNGGCSSSRGLLEKFDIHKFLLCNINICFGRILRNSLSQWLEEHVLLHLDSECSTAKSNRESSFVSRIIFPSQVPNHSWDAEDIGWGEAMCLADMRGEGWCWATDLKQILTFGKSQCVSPHFALYHPSILSA